MTSVCFGKHLLRQIRNRSNGFSTSVAVAKDSEEDTTHV